MNPVGCVLEHPHKNPKAEEIPLICNLYEFPVPPSNGTNSVLVPNVVTNAKSSAIIGNIVANDFEKENP
jgi:hypothetical protein